MGKELETRVQQAKYPIPKRNGANMSLPYYKKEKVIKSCFIQVRLYYGQLLSIHTAMNLVAD